MQECILSTLLSYMKKDQIDQMYKEAKKSRRRIMSAGLNGYVRPYLRKTYIEIIKDHLAKLPAQEAVDAG